MTIKYVKIEFENVEELREYVLATQKQHNEKNQEKAIVPEIPKPSNGKKYVWKFKWRAWTQEEDNQVIYAYNHIVGRNGRMPQGTVANLARKLKRSAAAVTARAEVLHLTAKCRK